MILTVVMFNLLTFLAISLLWVCTGLCTSLEVPGITGDYLRVTRKTEFLHIG